MKNRSKNVLKILSILIIVLSCQKVFAAEGKAYHVGDHFYFNPVENKKCNYKNYWTTINQNTTCYQFTVIAESASTSTTVKGMLSHDIAKGTFNEYQTVINNTKAAWTNFTGNIDIISESELKTLIKLEQTPAIGESIHRTDSATLNPLRANTIYYIAGKRYNDAGFWTKTEHASDTTYAHSLTESGNNRPVVKTSTRGFRPVITIDKSKVGDDKAVESLSETKVAFQYQHLTDKFGGYTYKQMQGFTMAGDKLFFYSSNNSNPNYGILFGYGGSNYATRLGYVYGEMAHGNDMAYNSKDGKIYVTGANEGKEVWEFNPATFSNSAQPSKKIPTSTEEYLNITPSGLAYSKEDDIFFAKFNANATAITKDFKTIKDSFPEGNILTGQGFGYNKGYVYNGSFDVGGGNCPNKYQLYCPGAEYTGTIFVYNAKYNSDGTPSPNFGRLVARYTVPASYGEIETISFNNNVMYLGFAAQHYDTTNTYKMVTTTTNVAQDPTYSVKYEGSKAIITSVEDIQAQTGWTLSTDKKTLSKTLTSSDTSVNVCDRYGNCNTEKLKTLDTITFQDNTTTYTGSIINGTGASAKSGSAITYTYYSDQSCTTKINSIVDVGTYSIKATSAGNNDYASNSKCAKLTVNKGNPIITLTEKTTNYSGQAVTPNTPSAKTPDNKNSIALAYTYKYYSDSSCQTEIAQPKNAGTYYSKATSAATANLNQASSNCQKLQVNKVDPTFTIQSSINVPLLRTAAVNFNSTSTGSVSCQSSDTETVTCQASSSKVTITTKKTGTATITLSQAADQNYNAKQNITLTVNVTDSSNDTIKPVVTITPDTDTSVTKTKTINVKFKDNETFIKENQTVYYAFSKSNQTEPTYEKSINLSATDETEKQITIPTTDMSNLTGTYYLWIKAGVKDINDNATQVKVSQVFKFNNTNPSVTGVVVKSSKGTKGTITTSSLSTISKREYSTDNTNFTTFTSSTFLTTNTNATKYYIRVTDNLNQSTTIEVNVIDESKTIIESYVVDKDNSNVINQIVDLTHKDLIYHISVQTPSLENIYEKYTKFEIKNEIDNKVVLDTKNVKIYNKSKEEKTTDFNLTYTNNILTISPKNVDSNNFYNEIYDIQIQTRIADNYTPSGDNRTFTNKTTLTINNNSEDLQTVESTLPYEEYSDIPNTKLDHNKLILIIGGLLIIVGTFVITKNTTKEQEN